MQSTIIPSLTVELAFVALGVVLLGLHITVQAMLLTRDLGTSYNASARDEQKSVGLFASRAERALRNFLETFPAFVAVALAVTIANKADGLSGLGAALYFWSRLVYLPLYVFGVPYLRSLAWLGAVAGISLILWRLLA
jgi:uncharacterized MAPEG superfamily protein